MLDAVTPKSWERGVAMTGSHLQEVRDRLKSKTLTDEDMRYIDGLLLKAEAEGLGQKIGDKRVVARLPNGMDIVK
jgi:hypothetical protein